MQTKTKMTVTYMAKVGVLSAIATVLMLIQFPLWFAPSFYQLDISEVPVLLGGFALGPVAAILIEAIKILLNFVIDGTSTGGIGELANFIFGCSLAVPAAIIYKYKKKLSGALIGLVIGAILMTIISALTNLFVLLPVYTKLMPVEAIINAGKAVNPNIINFETMVLWATIPFNIVKSLVASAITLLVYKKISQVLHK